MKNNQENTDVLAAEALQVYDTLLGSLQQEYCLPWVKAVFVPGHPCHEAYCDMHRAYARLRERFGMAEEDADAEQMIDCLLEHGKLLALEMFRYGRIFQKRQDKEKPGA